MSNSLKTQWGVDDAAEAGADEQSQQFHEAFEQQITHISEDLVYTAANAEASRHDPLEVRRNALYQSFQSALGQIDPANPDKAQGAIDKVLGAARAMDVEVTKFRQEAEKAKTDWDARQPKLDEAVSQVEELEAWQDPKAPALRGLVDGIRGQVNDRKYAPAVKTVDALLPKLKPFYDEYLKQKEAKENYEPALEALQPRLTNASAGEHVKLKPRQDEIAAAQKEMEASAQARNYVQALQQVGDLAAKVDNYEQAAEELEAQKKEYEEAWAALEPKFTEAMQSTSQKLSPLRDEMTALKGQIDQAVQAEDFEQALNVTNDLGTKVDAYLAAAEELDQQKMAYEDALEALALQPRVEEAAQAQYPKLAPQREEMAAAMDQMQAAAQGEDFEQALKLVYDLGTKADAYLISVEEIQKQKQTYEDGYAALQPQLAKAFASKFPPLAPMQQELTRTQGETEAAAEKQDYDRALQLLDDLNGNTERYFAEAAKLEFGFNHAYGSQQLWLEQLKKTERSSQPMKVKLTEAETALAQARQKADSKDFTVALDQVDAARATLEAVAMLDQEPQRVKFFAAAKVAATDIANTHPELDSKNLSKDLQQNWTALLQSLEQIKKIPEEADRPADAGDYAGANKLLDQVKPKLAEFQKKYEELKKKSGMKMVDVTVQAKDWDGAPIKEATGVVRFTVAKTPDVTLQGTFDKSGVVKFAGVSLMPAGVIFVQVTRTDGAVISPSGTGPYEVKGAGMIFTARQGISTGKSGGRSITEAVKNIGVEGTLGKDFKVVQAGLKVAGGILEKLVTEEYTEWNITAGTDALEVKQDR